ncbi:MAG: HK97 gp10 family phage protein [Blautia sp.]|nr:HK97 gp10 family phage protein [Blautia sp.]
MSVSGLNGVDDNFKKLCDLGAVETVIKKGIQDVRSEAIVLCPRGDGELMRSIFAEVERYGDRIIGTCWTNKEYAPYVEFGTGPVGQENHAGIAPDVTVSYRQTPWWIHESQVDASTAEKYHWPSIETKDGKFYRCSGQAAQPYMYPAMVNVQSRLPDMFRAEFSTAFDGKAKR